uniref:hypothetical protein n=1 Tax=Saccharothrix mutabilis TaxID=33921 RepID=UPI0031E2C0C2
MLVQVALVADEFDQIGDQAFGFPSGDASAAGEGEFAVPFDDVGDEEPFVAFVVDAGAGDAQDAAHLVPLVGLIAGEVELFVLGQQRLHPPRPAAGAGQDGVDLLAVAERAEVVVASVAAGPGGHGDGGGGPVPATQDQFAEDVDGRAAHEGGGEAAGGLDGGAVAGAVGVVEHCQPRVGDGFVGGAQHALDRAGGQVDAGGAVVVGDGGGLVVGVVVDGVAGAGDQQWGDGGELDVDGAGEQVEVVAVVARGWGVAQPVGHGVAGEGGQEVVGVVEGHQRSLPSAGAAVVMPVRRSSSTDRLP